MGAKLAPKLSNEGPFHSLQEPLLNSRGPCINPVTKDVDGHLALMSVCLTALLSVYLTPSF
jgi:hypothetical protein